MKNKVLCAIPCFNESYNLPNLFNDLALTNVANICDIIFINDFSSDNSKELILNEGYQLINHKENLGYGQSVQSGYNYAVQNCYEAIIIFPGDHQRSASDLIKLIEKYRNSDYDIVTGSKFHIYSQKYGPIRRRIGNQIFSKMAKYLWGSPIEDVLSGFKIYNINKVKPFFDILPKGYPFDIVFSLYAARFDLKVSELPVNCRYDDHTTKMKSVILVSIKMFSYTLVHYFFRTRNIASQNLKEKTST